MMFAPNMLIYFLLKEFPSRTAIRPDRKSTRLNSSHLVISYAVFCLKKKKKHRCKTRFPIPRFESKRTQSPSQNESSSDAPHCPAPSSRAHRQKRRQTMRRKVPTQTS